MVEITHVFPESVDMAYSVALDAISRSRDRLDQIEKRLHDVAAFGTAATLAILTLCAGKGLEYVSLTFLGAMACAILAQLAAAWIRAGYRCHLLDMEKVREWTQDDPQTFRRSMIRTAVNCDIGNSKLACKLAWAARGIMLLYTVEAICLGLWVSLP